MLEKTRSQYPSHHILLTFFSPSGYEVQKNYAGADHIFYLPLDDRTNARRFITIVQPALVLWIKYDYWFYYLTELRKKNIPIILVSGIFRKDQPFFKWYGRLHRYMLESFLHLFVQNQHSAQLLDHLGIRGNVTVGGDTRFDRVTDIAATASDLEGISDFCGQFPVLVAGSTWPEDEEELDHYANTHPQMRFVIAPHEIDEPHLHEVEKLFTHSVRYSAWMASRKDGNANTLIIDNIGMLSRLYRYATITYIGGGFGEDGVHNVLEAAVYGKPVVFGPVYEKYIEAAGLVDEEGAFSIDNALELEKMLDSLLAQPDKYRTAALAAANYVQARRGATEAVIRFIQEKRLLTS